MENQKDEDFSREYSSYFDDFSYTLRVEKNFQQQTQAEDCPDVWGGVSLYVGYGDNERCVAEYNYCMDIDGYTDCSAIYAVVKDEQGFEVIDFERCREYPMIDFNDRNWKWKLFQAMVDFHKEIEPQFMAA